MKNIWYLELNVAKDIKYLYTENYKILLKMTKET